MATPWPGTDQFTTVTVSGFYDNNTESPLFGVLGAPLPATGSPASASGVIIAGLDTNGNLQAVSMTPNGYVNVNATFSGTTVVDGTLSNNTAAPIADNLGVLPAIAESTVNPAFYTSGNQVLLVTDLAGNLNSDVQYWAGTALGVPTTWGTAPAGEKVIGVNAELFAGNTALSTTISGSPAVAALNVFVTNEGGMSTVNQGSQGTIPQSWYVELTNGTVVIGTAANPVYVQGTLSNNTAAPIADNFGVLPAVAATSYTTQTYANGNQVLLVTDLHGAINNDLQALAGIALGGPTLWGTAPTGEQVQGVNAEMFAGSSPLSTTAFGSPAVEALNSYIVNPVTVSGTVAVTQGTTPWVVAGNLSNNTAAPIADNVGALIAVTNSGTFPAVTLPAYTAGFQELLRVSQGGSLVTIPADEEYAQSINYFADDSGFTTLITLADATLVPLISIQSNSAAFSFLIREVTGYGDGSQIKFVLIKNPQTLTGAAFTATGIPTGSHIQRDRTATAVTIGTGTVVWSGMGASAPAHNEMLLQYMAAGAPGDTYTLAAQKFGTGRSKAFGSIRWSEEAAAI